MPVITTVPIGGVLSNIFVDLSADIIDTPNVRKKFYKVLRDLGYMHKRYEPTDLAIKDKFAKFITNKSLVRWNAYFAYERLKEMGKWNENRFLTSISEYCNTFFSFNEFNNNTYMYKPLTWSEFYSIFGDYLEKDYKTPNKNANDKIVRTETLLTYSWEKDKLKELFLKHWHKCI